MNKTAIIFIISGITLLTVPAFAQNVTAQLQSLIDAERGFAARSKETNTKQAFVDNLAPDAVLLEGGKEVNGLQSWAAKPEGKGLLFWEPVYADIASSNDFGWTTGPYWVYRSRTDTVAAFSGIYSTVWGKQPDGKWKVLFDLGGGVPPKKTLPVSTSSIPLKAKKKVDKVVEMKQLLDFEKSYVARVNSTGKSFEATAFSKEGRIHHPGRQSVIGGQEINDFDEPGSKFEFTPMSGRIASSGDMAYTYGTVRVTTEKEGSEPKVASLGSFRIWKKEDGKNWKIVLDVIGPQ